MQYVRSISGSVSNAWNGINPATLSGAIDVVVVEQEDGSLACSPFHVRFGKLSLLRPYDKKVEFRINGQPQSFPMKLGEGGEAFFVFETRESVPEALQTSPLVSPAASPELTASPPAAPALQEPDPFELEGGSAPKKRGHSRSTTEGMHIPSFTRKAQSDLARLSAMSAASSQPMPRPLSGDYTGYGDSLLPKMDRLPSDSIVPQAKAALSASVDGSEPASVPERTVTSSPLRTQVSRPSSPLPEHEEAIARAMNLSKKLWTSNISNHVTDSGDLVLDMTGFKSGNMEALQAEGIARQLLSEEIDGPYDIGALIGADEKGNIWIYSSEEAKEAADRKAAEGLGSYHPTAYVSTDALSDPGYHSDDGRSDTKSDYAGAHTRRDSDSALGLPSQPNSPAGQTSAGDPNKNYAKTLRLTSDQLKAMDLKSGGNAMTFTVNKATCKATLWYWQYNVPIVISDIDGTITKSDVWGHVLTSIGRDWTHNGVAKLYTEIASNGYNFLYLTSRSVGQADSTRAYLEGVQQDGFKLPRGPVILSPDRTLAALRREVYLRKPEIFKMACLRDIMSLFAGHSGPKTIAESAEAGSHAHPNPANVADIGPGKGKPGSPFYAGFGNRLTDALSYRSVNIPSTRIFTINSASEVSLDLLSLNKYKTAYSTMREIVDHYFPPVGLLVTGGGEDFTDFNYWREKPLDLVDFTDSEDEDEDEVDGDAQRLQPTITRELVLSEDEAAEELGDSYISEPGRSIDRSMMDGDRRGSLLEDDEDIEGEEEEEEDDNDNDGEEEEDDDDEEDEEDDEDDDDNNDDDDEEDDDENAVYSSSATPNTGRNADRSLNDSITASRSLPRGSTLDEQIDKMY